MRQLVFTIVLFLLIPNDILGQSRHSEYKILNDTIVALMKKKDKSKTIILYEDSNFIIKTSLINFRENNGIWVLEHYSCVKELFKQTEKDREVNVFELSRNDFKLRHEFTYITARLLEKGQCLVQNKKTKKNAPEVKIQKYVHDCDWENCQHGGKFFYINDIFLFRIMEWAAI